MNESTIERTVCAYAKAKGCLTLKLAGQNQRGQPDRLFLYKGLVLFIEFKAPGKLPTALQSKWLDLMAENGYYATWCDEINAGKKIIDVFIHADDDFVIWPKSQLESIFYNHVEEAKVRVYSCREIVQFYEKTL
jgi:hypothetical protein